MKRVTIQIAALAAILLLVCAGCRLLTHNTYVASVPVQRTDLAPESLRLEAETPGA